MEYVIPAVVGQTAVIVYSLGLPLLHRQKLVGAVGAFWCLMAMWIDINADWNPNYVAFCDFASWGQCTSVLKSPEAYFLRHYHLVPLGSIIDISNNAIGLWFYLAHCFYPQLKSLPGVGPYMPQLAFFGSCLAVLKTFYLASLKLVGFRVLCVLCIAVYSCNAVLWKVSVDSMRQQQKVD